MTLQWVHMPLSGMLISTNLYKTYRAGDTSAL